MAQRKLSPEEAKARAAVLWQRGSAVLTLHFRRRMAERRVTMADVGHLWETGTVQKSIQLDDENGRWEYTIRGRDLDGIGLAVVFAFDDVLGDLFLITVKDG